MTGPKGALLISKCDIFIITKCGTIAYIMTKHILSQ